MRKTIFSLGIFFFSIILILGSGGSGDSGDSGGGGSTDATPPSGILFTGLTVGDDSIRFTWEDPSDEDFDHVTVTCTDGSDTLGPFTIESGIRTYTLNSLIVETSYTVTIKTVDTAGNASDGYCFTVKTLASGADEEDFLKIYTAEDLNAVRGGVTGYENWGLEGNYLLMNDIDLSQSDFSTNWTPIGDAANATTMFKGAFLGNGYEISRLIINTTDDFQGLFSGIDTDGTVQNLGVTDAALSVAYTAGVLAGRNYGAIINCYSTGTITGTNIYIGGLVGHNYGGTIANSNSACDVNGDDYAGGLVGRNGEGGEIIDSCTSGTISGAESVGGLVGYNRGGIISGCCAAGDVSGTSYYIGGLVGFIEDNDITDSYINSVSDSYATGNVSSDAGWVGGLIGGSEYCETTDCYATGNITTEGSSAGGLIGSNSDGAITGCHASGAVIGSDSYIGGLVGNNSDSSPVDSYEGTISNSFTTAPSVSGSTFVGGLVGGNSNGVITFCYADISGNVEGQGLVGGLVGAHTNVALGADHGVITYSFAKVAGRVNAGNSMAGGLVGRVKGLSVKYSYAYAAGGVSADGTDGDGYYAGGLVGYSDTCSVGADIINCYTFSNITGNNYLGGLAGIINVTTIRNCYAAGIVDSTDTNSTDGGLVGYINSGTVADSYFNNQNTGNYGTAVSLEDMQLQSTFSVWDFTGETANGTEDIWSIGSLNSGYPYLTDLPPGE